MEVIEMCPLLSAFHLDLSRTLLLRTLSNSTQCTEEKKKKKAVLFQPNRGRQIAESLQQLPVCDARNILEMIHYRPVFFSWIHPDFRGQPGRLLSLTKWSISLSGSTTVASIRSSAPLFAALLFPARRVYKWKSHVCPGREMRSTLDGRRKPAITS